MIVLKFKINIINSNNNYNKIISKKMNILQWNLESLDATLLKWWLSRYTLWINIFEMIGNNYVAQLIKILISKKIYGEVFISLLFYTSKLWSILKLLKLFVRQILY